MKYSDEYKLGSLEDAEEFARKRDHGPRYKDVMINDFNLRFWEEKGQWVCTMPGWLLDVFEKEMQKRPAIDKENGLVCAKCYGSLAPQTKPLSDLEQDACFNRGYKEGVRDSLLKTKPLSDEEILETIKEWGRKEFLDDYADPTDESLKYMLSLMRAIEAKVRGKK